MRNKFTFLFLIAQIMFSQGEVSTISGRVRSKETQEPIIGATVRFPRTTIGTSTDNKGYFILHTVPKEVQTLSVSAIGYTSVIIEFHGDESLEIELDEAPIQTHTVVVTANKREQTLEEIPVSMNILSTAQLNTKYHVALDDALRYVPGVNFQQSQVNIRASSGYSRGVGSRVLLLVDGLPLLSGDTGEINFEVLPLDQIERVEVLKGAGSTLYGSGALGGVINVLTKGIPEGTHVFWRLHGGLYDEPQPAAWKWSSTARTFEGQLVSVSQRWNEIGLVVSAQRSANNGYRESDWLRKYAAYIKMQYDLSPFQSLTFSTNYYHHDRADFLWWKSIDDALLPFPTQRNTTVTSDRWNTTIGFSHFVDESFFYDIKAFHYAGNWQRDSTSKKSLDGSGSTNSILLVQGNYVLSEKHILVGGAEVSSETVNSGIFGIHSSIGTAFFIQDELNVLPSLRIISGLRFDRKQIDDNHFYQQVNPKLAMQHILLDGVSLRASVGRGFRTPSVGELFISTANTGSAVSVMANPELRPEHSWSYELGMMAQLHPRVTLDMALFQSDYSDLVEVSVQPAPVTSQALGMIQFKNITQARIQGYEMQLTGEVLKNRLTITTSYNYNWAIDRSTNAYLRFRPRHLFTLQSEYRDEAILVGLESRAASRIEQIDDNLVKLAPIYNGEQRVPIYVTDLRIGVNLDSFGIPARLSVQVNNVLNYSYAELIGNISPLRHYVVTFEGTI